MNPHLRNWLATFRFLRRYHRYEVTGLEYLLTGRACLVVGYHGRPLAWDLCILTVELYERLGYLPHGVMHGAFESKALRSIIDGLGFVTGDGPGIAAAAARGEHVVVLPGGTREGCRSFRHRYELSWGRRHGYLRLALRHDMPIVPVASRGVDDAFIGLNDGYALGKRLNAPMRLPVWFGLGLGGLWPFALPLPVKFRQRVGTPIDLRAEGLTAESEPGALAAAHSRVSDAVRALLAP